MTHKLLIQILFISAIICVSACDGNDDGQTNYSKNGVEFVIPKDWEILEDTNINGAHRTINLITSHGSLVGIDTLNLSGSYARIDINTLLKRHVASALPTEALKANANFDFGEQTRAGHKGMFVHVATSAPIASSFLIEAYQLPTDTGSTFVVYSTPDPEVDLLQNDFDCFLQSISIVGGDTAQSLKNHGNR